MNYTANRRAAQAQGATGRPWGDNSHFVRRDIVQGAEIAIEIGIGVDYTIDPGDSDSDSDSDFDSDSDEPPHVENIEDC